ncbi:MAG: hypothetical protein ABW170_04350 [Candidatus Thiodiazotropha sp. L084R]
MKKRAFSLALLIFVSFSSYSQSLKEDEWGEKYDEIIKEACGHIEGECLVNYSAYPNDKDELPINNLKQVAIKGKVVILKEHDPFWGAGKNFKSKLLVNPTWLELTIEANKMILTTGDRHHRYLEGFDVLYEKDGTKFVGLSMGS